MNKICDVLKPFADATYITQGNKRITISDAVPTTFDLTLELRTMSISTFWFFNFNFFVLFVIVMS